MTLSAVIDAGRGGAVLFWTVLGFALGTLPFSVWLGRAMLRVDVREFGDHNPGATNVWRAGGWRPGLVVALLDVSKAAVPVWFARHALGDGSWALVPVGLAPLLGHALSPFLGFRGGKSTAATFGVWLGVGGWVVALALAVCFAVFYLMQTTDAWTTILGSTLWAVALVVRGAALSLVALAVLNVALLAWRHWSDLSERPRWRHWGPAGQNE